MEAIHPQYVIDERGFARSVVLEIGEFERLVRSAGIEPEGPPSANPLRVSDLGWTREEAQDTRTRLRSFDGDWNAPGMEAYDRM